MPKKAAGSNTKLPSNVEAERSVLASIFIDPTTAEAAVASLNEEDFSDVDPRNAIIFNAISELSKKRQPIGAQSIINQLASLGQSEAVPASYIYELIDMPVIPDNISNYIQMVSEQSILRKFLLAMKDIENQYANGVSDIGDFIQASNDRIGKISQSRTIQDMESAKTVAARVHEELKTRNQVGGVTGITTGYTKLNEITHGWHPGELIIVAARPSVGKTAFTLNLAWNAASLEHKPVAFFSLEMSSDQIMTRLISMVASVSGDSLATGYFKNRASDMASVANAVNNDIANTPLYFDDTPNSKIGDIVAKARRMKIEHPDLALIVVDYLGRISYGDRSNPNGRQQEVSEICGTLKTLARNLEVPVICVCQLNRNVESTETKKPSLANLRESGSIEQDADVVMLLYRPDYYTAVGQSVKKKSYGKQEGKTEEEEEEKPKKPSDASDVTVMIAKNRTGKTGQVYLVFEKQFSRFSNPTKEYENERAAYYQRMGDDE